MSAYQTYDQSDQIAHAHRQTAQVVSKTVIHDEIPILASSTGETAAIENVS